LRHVDDVIRRYSVKLVVVDPLTAHLGRADGYKDQDIRSVLAPLAGLGSRYGTTILPIRHLTKNTGAAAVHRGGGSIAIGAAARLILLVSLHPDDRSRRLLSVVKS